MRYIYIDKLYLNRLSLRMLPTNDINVCMPIFRYQLETWSFMPFYSHTYVISHYIKYIYIYVLYVCLNEISMYLYIIQRS